VVVLIGSDLHEYQIGATGHPRHLLRPRRKQNEGLAGVLGVRAALGAKSREVGGSGGVRAVEGTELGGRRLLAYDLLNRRSTRWATTVLVVKSERVAAVE
jgi:hypothetical protein